MRMKRVTFDCPEDLAEEIQLLALASRQTFRELLSQLVAAAYNNLELDPVVQRAVDLLRTNPQYLEQARENARSSGKGIRNLEPF